MSDTPGSAGPVASNPTGCELRVHGIGSHGPLSALGAPTVEQMSIADDSESPVSVYLPPAPVGHELRLLNWSRVTRRGFGPGWWFLFPLTVGNAAGYATPQDDHGAVPKLHTTMMWFWSSVLTIGYVLWSFALIETLPRVLPYGVVLGLEIAALGAFAAVVGHRIWSKQAQPVGPRGRDVCPPKALWALQLVLVLGIGIAVLAIRPGNLVVHSKARTASPGMFATSCWNAPSGTHCANRVDILSGYVVVTTALVFAGLLVVLLACRGGRVRSSSIRATTVIAAAVVLLNTVFSGLRSALSWFSRYLAQLPGLRFTCADRRWNGCLPETQDRKSLLPYHRGGDWPAYDLVPAAIIWLGLVALVIFLFIKLARMLRAHLRDEQMNDVRGRFEQKVEEAEQTNRRINDLPFSARTPLLFVAVGLALFACLSIVIALEHNSAGGEPYGWFVTVAGHIAAVLIPLVVIATLAFAPVRTAVSLVGDVIGYWPRGFVALSGTSYTNVVCERIQSEVDAREQPIVVTGHSQGSVLAYTTLTRMATAPGSLESEGTGTPLRPLPPHLALVTCGSPLVSLYGTFFPMYFGRGEFSRLREALGGRWSNCWRPTDPIASELFVPGDGDLRIEPHIDFAGKLTKHSYYWNEPVQRSAVSALLAEMGVAPEASSAI